METLFSCIAGYLCVFCEKFAKYLSGPKASAQMWHPCSYLDKDCASLQFISCSALWTISSSLWKDPYLSKQSSFLFLRTILFLSVH